ncbi:MAG: endonuclease V [Candidatus Manganitrophus sp.]|nr:endonuclease V [Candidatus Manganitrophus sp.]
MNFLDLHRWDVTPLEAIEIQNRLRRQLILDQAPAMIRMIAGVDVSNAFGSNRLFAAVVVLDLPTSAAEGIPDPGGRDRLVGGRLSICPRSSFLPMCLRVSPSIGCGKTRLIGFHREPGPLRGEWSPLIDRGETIGAVLRTRDRVSPVFISPGHRMTLDRAIEIVLSSQLRYRLPEPTRMAHQLVNEARRAA